MMYVNQGRGFGSIHLSALLCLPIAALACRAPIETSSSPSTGTTTGGSATLGQAGNTGNSAGAAGAHSGNAGSGNTGNNVAGGGGASSSANGGGAHGGGAHGGGAPAVVVPTPPVLTAADVHVVGRSGTDLRIHLTGTDSGGDVEFLHISARDAQGAPANLLDANWDDSPDQPTGRVVLNGASGQTSLDIT